MSLHFIPDHITSNVATTFVAGQTYVVILDPWEKDVEENLVFGLVTYPDPKRSLIDRTIIQSYDATDAIWEVIEENNTKGNNIKDVTLQMEWNHFYNWVNSQNIPVLYTQEVLDKFEQDFEDFDENDGYIDPEDGMFKYDNEEDE